MKIRYITFFFALVIFCSCSDGDDGRPDVPENVRIDIDDDGDQDFTFKYQSAEILGGDAIETVSCVFEVIGRNEVFTVIDEPLISLDSIERMLNPPVTGFEFSDLGGDVTLIEKNAVS